MQFRDFFFVYVIFKENQSMGFMVGKAAKRCRWQSKRAAFEAAA